MSMTMQASANPSAGDNTPLPAPHQPGILHVTAEMRAKNKENGSQDAAVAQVGEGGDAGGVSGEMNAPGAPRQQGMANSKESTPMGLLNVIARFNNVTKPEYKLVNEVGPAHEKVFTVSLQFGGSEYQGIGTSIKRAQHGAAQKALDVCTLRRPEPRKRDGDKYTVLRNINQDALTSTVELNSLALKTGLKVKYENPSFQVQNPYPQFNYGGYQKKKKRQGVKENQGEDVQMNGAVPGALPRPMGRPVQVGPPVGPPPQVGPPQAGQPRPMQPPSQMGPPQGIPQVPPQQGNMEDGMQQGLGGAGAPPFTRMPGQQGPRMRGPRGPQQMGYYPPMGFQQQYSGGRYPMYRPRFRRPFPPVFCIKLSVEDREFIGQGPNQRAARQDAAAKAMQSLKENPIPEKKDKSTSMVEGEPEVESLENESANSSSSKSEISQVYEIANFNGLALEFKVLDESGPPHLKTYKYQCTVGNIVVEESGSSKKEAKRKAAAAVLPKLKSLPPPEKTIRQPRPGFGKQFFQKKKNPNIKKPVEDPDFGSPGMDPVSRLVQICQGKKLKDPTFETLHDQPIPDRSKGRGTIYRHIFTVQVSCSDIKADGKGSTKKEAKKEAAEALLKKMGYNPTPPADPDAPNVNKPPGPDATPTKSALKQDGQEHKDEDGSDRKVTFKDDQDKSGKQGNENVETIPGSQQQGPHIPGITPGLFPMMPGVKQTPRYPGDQMPQPQGLNRAPGAPVKRLPPSHKYYNAALTADIAQELLLTKRSRTAESIFHGGEAVSQRPRHLLEYLGNVCGLDIKFNDFPQANKPDHLSLVSISTDPPISIHGSGPTVEASHDLASVNILRALAGFPDDSGSNLGAQAQN